MRGPSEEREVSLSTGMAVIDACQKIGYNPTKISFDQDYESYLPKMKKQDIIFNALHGGIGENGKIQIWMDNNQIKYTGSDSYSSSLCMNKAKSKDIALKNGVNTAKWQLINHKDETILIEMPYVIKPNEQGSTFGLSIVLNEQEIIKRAKFSSGVDEKNNNLSTEKKEIQTSSDKTKEKLDKIQSEVN